MEDVLRGSKPRQCESVVDILQADLEKALQKDMKYVFVALV